MNDTIKFRRADCKDVALLSEIACRSEAYWNYSDEFMEIFRSQYGVTEDFVEVNSVFLMENDQRQVGFYGLIIGNPTELEFFYIEPECIGKGYGRIMWEHLLELCHGEKIDSFVFVTSPQAVPFYEKMGAEVIGSTCSSVDGRNIPKLSFQII